MENRPKLLITIQGGLIVAIEGNTDIDILVADYDINDEDPIYGVIMNIKDSTDDYPSTVHVHKPAVTSESQSVEFLNNLFLKYEKLQASKILKQSKKIILTEEFEALDGFYSINVYNDLSFALETPHAAGFGTRALLDGKFKIDISTETDIENQEEDVQKWIHDVMTKLLVDTTLKED